MKKRTRKNRKHKSAHRYDSARSIPKVVFLFVFLFLAATILALTGFWVLNSRDAAERPPTSSSASVQTGFQQLKGRWQRSDSDYVIEIRGIDSSGRMEASYFNPRSIHVARAEASRQGALVKVSIELRDEGYPGSTYDLTYDESRGALYGKYYQAAIKETFDVVFVKAS